MPPFFVEWLRALTDEQATAMWEFLDSTSELDDLIEILAISHPTVEAKLSGETSE